MQGECKNELVKDVAGAYRLGCFLSSAGSPASDLVVSSPTSSSGVFLLVLLAPSSAGLAVDVWCSWPRLLALRVDLSASRSSPSVLNEIPDDNDEFVVVVS